MNGSKESVTIRSSNLRWSQITVLLVSDDNPAVTFLIVLRKCRVIGEKASRSLRTNKEVTYQSNLISSVNLGLRHFYLWFKRKGKRRSSFLLLDTVMGMSLHKDTQ